MKHKRIAALLIAAVLFVCLFPSDVFAAKLRICDNEDYPETYHFNAGAANLPAEFRNHSTSNFNLYYLAGSYDTAVYCIQMSSPNISWERDYGTYTSPQATQLTDDQITLLSAALCMGHTGGWENRPFQVATQIIVWMITTGAYANDAQRDAILNDYILDSNVKAYAKQLWDDCIGYFTIPSFCCPAGGERPVYDMEYDAENGTYYVDLVDENGVLERYEPFDLPAGISYEKNGNTLRLISDAPYLEDVEIKMQNTTGRYQNRAYLMYMYLNEHQEMAYQLRRQVDPRGAFLKLAALYSSATIIKQSEDDLVSGLKFRITKPGDDTFEPIILETDENGTTQEAVVGLGTYKVEEIDTPARYIQPEPQTFTINVIGEKVVLTFVNKCRDLTLVKTSEDNKVEGLEFRVTCEELQYGTTIKTDSEGCWSISGLEPGQYLIEEINVPDQYTQMEDITVNVTYDQEEYTVTAENTLKRGKVEVNKKDSMFGKNLANAKFGIYTSEGELVQEVVTDSKGVVVSDVLTYGNYYLKELQPAFGYKQNETEYEFSIDADGKYEIIVVEDDPKIGKIIVTHGPRGIVDTGSVTGAVLPLGLAVMFLCLILIGISIRKQTAFRHR